MLPEPTESGTSNSLCELDPICPLLLQPVGVYQSQEHLDGRTLGRKRGLVLQTLVGGYPRMESGQASLDIRTLFLTTRVLSDSNQVKSFRSGRDALISHSGHEI